MYYKFFPPAIIALNLEVIHHPLLQQRLEKHVANLDNFEVRFAEIAAYVNVEMDGIFEETDFIQIAQVCLFRLENMRPAPRIYLPEDNYEKFLKSKKELM